MGRYFFGQHDQNDDTDGEMTTQNMDGDDRHFDDVDDDQSREEGEIIEAESDEEENLTEPHGQQQPKSFFSFPRLWRQRSGEQHEEIIGEGRYTRIASSDFNPISDDEQDGEDEEDECFRCHDTSLSRRQNDELTDSTSYQDQQGIHYHIYIPESAAERWLSARYYRDDDVSFDTRHRKSKGTPWKFVTLLAFITQIVYWYGPSVPPPPTPISRPPPSQSDLPLSWVDYWRQQSDTVLHMSYESFVLVKHVTYWSLLAMEQDWRSFWTKWVSQEELQDEHDNGVRWTFPSTWNLREHHDYDSFTTIPLLGQNAALDRVENILNSWTRKLNKEKPLILYVSGGKAVGKQSLALMLLEKMVRKAGSEYSSILEDCKGEVLDLMADNPLRSQFGALVREDSVGDHVIPLSLTCPLLRLTCDDFHQHNPSDDSGLDNKDITSMIYDRIATHVQRLQSGSRGGTIVLLQHVDEYPPKVLAQVMEKVQSDTSIFRSTIVVMTSMVGTMTMDKWVRKKLMQQQHEGSYFEFASSWDMHKLLLSAEGEAMLRYEVQQYHHYHDHNASANPILSMDGWNIVPLMSLDTSTMGNVLNHLAIANDIHMTSSSISHLLESLEWHQWLHKTSGKVVQAWSPYGVLPLFKLWEDRVQRNLEYLPLECRSVDEYNDNVMMVLDCDGTGVDHFFLRKCHSEEMVNKDDVDANDDFETVAIEIENDGKKLAVQCPKMQHTASCSFYL
jgi:hypothetical protein